MAHTCVFTPPHTIAFGKRGTVLGAAAAPTAPVLNKRDGKSGLFGLAERAIAVWSLEPVAADTAVRPTAPGFSRHQFQRTPLGSRPPPITL